MTAVILILLFVIMIIVLIANLSNGQQERQVHSPTSAIRKIDIPVTVTVSYGKSNSEENTSIEAPLTDPEKLWIPPGESVTVKGFQIPGGMVYVGKNLAAKSGYGQVEPSLINPDLSVHTSHPDHAGSSLSYWPSYSSISPEARAAYLEWLAQGRRLPGTNIGYVFLFFYGLERRLLVDANQSEKAPTEATSIIQEVEELRQVYGDNGSFNGYATSFLEYARIKFLPGTLDHDPPHLKRGWEFPLSLKLGLANFAEGAKPLPSEWALAWAQCDPQRSFRTPAHRCRDEFSHLFAARYRKMFGEGIVLKPNKTKIKIEYRPSSGGLLGQQVSEELHKPDVTALTAPLKAIHQIADECVDELDAYSRLLGRRPEEANSLAAVALLPDEVLAESRNEKLTELKRVVEERSKAADPCIFKTKELLPLFDIEQKEKLTKPEAVSITQLLGRIGYAAIPDVRFDEGRVDPQGSVLICHSKSSPQAVASKAYSAALMFMKIAFVVSASDSKMTSEEESLLESHIEKIMDLTDYEKERLHVYLLWLHLSPPDLTGLKRGLSELGVDEKQAIAEFAVKIASADGFVHPEEIKALRRIYLLLGSDPERMYSDIHRTQTSTDEQIVTVVSGDAKPGYQIPMKKDHRRERPGIALDDHVIEKTLRDTAKVQAILAQVFEDIEPTSPLPQVKQAGIIGLDGAHSGLLLALLAKPIWQQDEFESMCAKCGVLPAGAIETINCKTFERYNDSLIEERESIEINAVLAKEIER